MVYPATGVKIWSPADTNFQYPADLKTVVYARHVTSLYDEVTALESHLGPSGVATSSWGGSFSSVTTGWNTLNARLNNIEAGVKDAYDGRVKTAGNSVVTSSDTNIVGVTFTATSGQTVDQIQIKNSSGTLVSSFDKDGYFNGVIDGGTV